MREHRDPYNRIRSRKRKVTLRFLMVIVVFLTLVLSAIITGIIASLLIHMNIFNTALFQRNALIPIVAMLIFSTLFATFVTGVMGNRTLHPVREVIDATKKVAEGDFSVRLEETNVPEFRELNRSFNKMVKDLNGIETLRSDFTNNFAHEFKTPIVSIRGFAKLLLDENITKDEHDEYVQIIINESERLSELSTSVLELSKIENTSILSDKKEFYVDEQIRQVVAFLEPRWKIKNISFDIDLDETKIYTDENILYRVWFNLIDNAIKFSNDKGIIAITLSNDEEIITVNIEDSGKGMDEITIKKIFDKFYQGDSSHSEKGNGLGLSLVAKAVELCGGEVQVSSTIGIGSRFTVKLPIK